ncbi:hypothetical protein ACFYXF_00030 [Streptomyces sp. NPDC002680]|uniref:hypothetical protein n=1 Tax=Streptomyces sp. NPDC002680 TaxID=3364659 RepID=UPI003699923F
MPRRYAGRSGAAQPYLLVGGLEFGAHGKGAAVRQEARVGGMFGSLGQGTGGGAVAAEDE